MLILLDGLQDDTDIDIDDDRHEEMQVDGVVIVSTAARASVRNPIWMA